MDSNEKRNAEKELMFELMKGEQSGQEKGWTDFANVEKKLNITSHS